MGLARSYPIAVAKMCRAVHTGPWSASAAQGTSLEFWPMRRDTLYFCLIWLTAVGGTMIVGFLIG
jgi:hypothetical protein